MMRSVMAMLEYNEIAPRKFIILDGEPYEVLSSHVFRKQQRKPVNQTKLKGLMSGRVVEKSFHQAEKAEEADMGVREIMYLFNKRGQYWFCELNDKGNRYELPEQTLGEQVRFLKENTVVEALIFDEKVIGIHMPIKVELKVTEAPPNVKGNTATGGYKVVTLETEATIDVPMFINAGDVIRINTETGQYVERVNKG